MSGQSVTLLAQAVLRSRKAHEAPAHHWVIRSESGLQDGYGVLMSRAGGVEVAEVAEYRAEVVQAAGGLAVVRTQLRFADRQGTFKHGGGAPQLPLRTENHAKVGHRVCWPG